VIPEGIEPMDKFFRLVFHSGHLIKSNCKDNAIRFYEDAKNMVKLLVDPFLTAAVLLAKARITQEDDIEQAIYNLSEYNVDMDSSDMIAAKKDFYKKLKRIKDTDERVVRNKLYSFMASKGYSYKITGELIEEFVNNNNYDKNY
jgi:hypothetical protein